MQRFHIDTVLVTDVIVIDLYQRGIDQAFGQVKKLAL